MELKGIVIFKLANKGSMSENINPYLYVSKGKFIKIYFENDNPFENKVLDEFDGKYVLLDGEYDEYNTFVISKITPAKNEEEFVLCGEKEEKKIDAEAEIETEKK